MARINIELSADAALVIFELLHRWEEPATERPSLENSEWSALWELSAVLERLLVEPFSADYDELVAKARSRLVVGLDPTDVD